MIDDLLLSFTSNQFIETITTDKILSETEKNEKIQKLQIKNIYYQEKYNKIKTFLFKRETIILSRNTIYYFEWIKSYINFDYKNIDRTNKDEIFNEYKNVIYYFKYIFNLYVDFLKKYDDNDNSSVVLQNTNTNNNFLNILNNISIKNQIPIPFILYPEFVLDKFIYHRSSYSFSNDDLFEAEKLFNLFQLYYYTLLNHMEEYEFIITEINKELLELL